MSDFAIETRFIGRHRRLCSFEFLAISIVLFAQIVLHDLEEVLTQLLQAISRIDHVLVKFAHASIQVLALVLGDVGRERSCPLLDHLQFATDALQEIVVRFGGLLRDGSLGGIQ